MATEGPTGAGVELTGPARLGAVAQVFVDDVDHPVPDHDDLSHLLRSLRLRPGETVVVADGRGRFRPTRVTGSHEPDRVLEPDGPPGFDERPVPRLTVAFVPVKGERPEWVVQKLTELGVDRVVVLRSSRSVVRWEAGRQERNLDKLRRVSREAAAQCRRAWLPELHGVLTLAEAAAACGGGVTSPAVAVDGPSPLRLAEPGGSPVGPEVRAVAVGPEGGWAEEELALGLPRVGLGPAVLRAETAAVAAGALLCAIRDGTLGRP